MPVFTIVLVVGGAVITVAVVVVGVAWGGAIVEADVEEER